MKNICILGATGSIGTQTLDVIEREKDKFKLIAVSAKKSYDKIIDIISKFHPEYAVLMEEDSFIKVRDYCNNNNENTKILMGMEGLVYISTLEEVDMVVTSVVGMVGLLPTMKAIEKGKDIALANKETLVVAGEIIMKKAKEMGVSILPVDSEHGAIFQCLQGNKKSDIHKIILTASGGPFRGRKKETLLNVTSKEALKHPKWNMGRKISIDSATLMNKGLEVIEAHFLFDVDYDDVQVVVHPQSMVHSMIEYIDGSIMAQIASADMRLPIQYAMNYPKREKTLIDRVDFYKLKELTFEKPDMDTFIPLKLAYKAGKIGGSMPCILNAANEACVELFLEDKIKFLDIGNILKECMNKFKVVKDITLDIVIDTDKKVKKYVKEKYSNI